MVRDLAEIPDARPLDDPRHRWNELGLLCIRSTGEVAKQPSNR
jgi:hypothetical protein